MELAYEQLLRAACLFVPIFWEMFGLESIRPVDNYNMPLPGSGVYVSMGSYQWIGRLRFYQKGNEERLSIVDQSKGSTASHSEREFTTKTSDILGIWMEITRANAAIICLLFFLLFCSQIFPRRVRRNDLEHVLGYEDQIPRVQAQQIANRGRSIGLEDRQGNFGRTHRDAAARHAMPYYWVVFVGRNPGIYTTWEEAKANTNRCSRNKCKRYNTLNEAVEELCEFHVDRYFSDAIGQNRTQHQASVGASTSARPLSNQSVVERAPNVRIRGLVVIFFLGFVTCILLAHLFDSE